MESDLTPRSAKKYEKKGRRAPEILRSEDAGTLPLLLFFFVRRKKFLAPRSGRKILAIFRFRERLCVVDGPVAHP